MSKKFKFVSVLVICLIFPLLSYAQEASEPAEGSAKAAVKPEDPAKQLGEWWTRNSLTYDPMPTQWLYHGEVKFGYNRATGNLTLESYDIDGLLAVRKERVTGQLHYGFQKSAQSTVLGGDSKRRVENLLPSLRYDLMSRVYTEIGGLWTKDDDRAIYDRRTYFFGFGYEMNTIPDYMLTVFLAIAHEDLEYNELVTINGEYPGILRNTAYYGEQDFKWNIMENIAFNERFVLIGYISEGSNYRWTLNLGLEYALTPYLALRLDYEYNYFNFQPEILGQELEKRDQKQGIMVKLSF